MTVLHHILRRPFPSMSLLLFNLEQLARVQASQKVHIHASWGIAFNSRWQADTTYSSVRRQKRSSVRHMMLMSLESTTKDDTFTVQRKRVLSIDVAIFTEVMGSGTFNFLYIYTHQQSFSHAYSSQRRILLDKQHRTWAISNSTLLLISRVLRLDYLPKA